MRTDLDEQASEENKDLKNFRWEVIDFNRDFIWLQIYFENPEEIGAFFSKDYITVEFWGVEFFKSYQGVEVKFGT